LLRRLSVFVGGCTLEAAAICTDEESQAAVDSMLQRLGELGARSLVSFVEHVDTPRYRLLETTRQYAHDRLIEAGEAERIQERHRLWYLEQLSRAGAARATDGRDAWLDRLEGDLDNLRAALALCMQHPTGREAILERAEPIALLCLVRGHLEEGRRWLAAALADHRDGIFEIRALALNAAATLASEHGDYEQAMTLYQEGIAHFEALGDVRGGARLLINLGNVMKYQGNHDQARALYEEGCRRAREHGDRGLLALALNNVGTLAIEQGDTDSAAAVLEESLMLKRQSGSQAGVIQVLVNLGEVARARNDLSRATDYYEEALPLAQALGDRLHVALLHYNLALVAGARGAHDRAAIEFQESLRQEQVLGNKRQIANNLEGLATVAAGYGQPELAARLLGAAELLREQIGAPVPDVDRPNHERNVSGVRGALTAATAASAWARGRAMPLSSAIAEALELSRPAAH
jgi:tetratricopeptide (TPR) repeat protein